VLGSIELCDGVLREILRSLPTCQPLHRAYPGPPGGPEAGKIWTLSKPNHLISLALFRNQFAMRRSPPGEPTSESRQRDWVALTSDLVGSTVHLLDCDTYVTMLLFPYRTGSCAVWARICFDRQRGNNTTTTFGAPVWQGWRKICHIQGCRIEHHRFDRRCADERVSSACVWSGWRPRGVPVWD
jgi:hypothetical protein